MRVTKHKGGCATGVAIRTRRCGTRSEAPAQPTVRTQWTRDHDLNLSGPIAALSGPPCGGRKIEPVCEADDQALQCGTLRDLNSDDTFIESVAVDDRDGGRAVDAIVGRDRH